MTATNARLQASFHIRAIRQLSRADAVAGRVAAVATRLRARLLELAPGLPHTAYLVRKAIEKSRDDLVKEFEAGAYAMIGWSYRSSARAMLAQIPPLWWRIRIPELPVKEAEMAEALRDWKIFKWIKLLFHGVPDPGLASDPNKPPVQKAMTKKQAKDAVEQLLFPPLPFKRVAEILKAPGPNGINYKERLTSLSKKVTDPAAVVNSLSAGIAKSETIQQLRQRVDKFTGPLHGSSLRIARTEVSRVAETASREAWSDLGDLLEGGMILAVLDERTRPHHALRHGTTYYPDRPPFLSEMPDLPDEPNSILPGNIIRGSFCAGSKASYSGEAVQVVARSGRSITVTANHPVLTVDGFVPARSLLKGCKLLCHRRGIEPWPANYVQNAPAKIEQIFCTLEQLGPVRFRESVGMDFHGDERSINGDVEIVSVNRKLLTQYDAFGTHRVSQQRFQRTDMQLEFVPRLGSHAFSGERVAVSASCAPSPFALPDDCGAVSLDFGPLQFLGFGLPPVLSTALDQEFRQPGRLTAIESATAYPGLFGELENRFASVVSVDEVLSVETFNYSGHVYDLQTSVGWYFCSDIIVKNCRCTSVPVMIQPEGANAMRLNALRDKTGNIIPEPSVYDRWFMKASIGARREAVGVRRYNLVADQLKGKRTPEWIDFVAPDGTLMPVAALQSESLPARAARREAVNLLLRQRERDYHSVALGGFVTPIRKAPAA